MDQPRPVNQPGRIDVVSDAICPWCWVGKRNLEGALAILAAEGERFAVHWRAFQLNPDMPAEGVDRASYRAAKFGSEERGRELDAQVAAAGRAAGLEFRHDLMRRTPNTIAAHRLIRWAGEQGLALQAAVQEALFRAYFQEGRDIGQPEVLAALAGEAGLDAAAAAAFLAGGEGAEEVRAEDAGFRQAGLSGVPTFALEGHVLFSGAMPAERIAEAIRRGLAILRRQAA
ncbi:MAG: 2-hydroxychromene-2-carboxylate isomerase/DsbA-like thioredoxin domain [uncultured Craurococcus sp.]|uniref:2-hydroxychromene-2-carboxylate isomerase/DsbA-like thioredoxin domain n=1 Tax=uncultured Craurococcus sp. TaxID=1135998 RepID=A0A6J4I2X2_9PROT|nr:MAG: 2-hydroxychromene-2-carboxylate isomerase/DsbA-like thioredoxin domain [uncultured Craurococcus sp.]